MTNIWPSVQPSEKRTWRHERRRAQGRSCVRGLRGSGQHFLSWETSVSWELLPKVVNRSKLTLAISSHTGPVAWSMVANPLLQASHALARRACPARLVFSPRGVGLPSKGAQTQSRDTWGAAGAAGRWRPARGSQCSSKIPLKIHASGECKDEEQMFPTSARNSQWEEGVMNTRASRGNHVHADTLAHTHTCTHTHMLTSSASWNSPFQLGQLRLSENSFKFIFNKKINCGAIHRT